MIRLSIAAAVTIGSLVAFSNPAEAEFGRRVGAVRQGAISNTGPGVGSAAAWGSQKTWGDYWAYNQSMSQPWHGDYYYLRTGQPTALVVPPNVTMQSHHSWGVSQNTMTPVYHQFSGRAANGGGGGMFKATPVWPSHTNQFGVYPVRGPW